MKLALLALGVFVAVAYADVSEIANEYLPPFQGNSIAGGGGGGGGGFAVGGFGGQDFAEPGHVLADDGYRYKKARRLKLRRHRRRRV